MLRKILWINRITVIFTQQFTIVQNLRNAPA